MRPPLYRRRIAGYCCVFRGRDYVITTILGLLFLAGCAVPVPPTGGPPDQTPPSLVSSSPEDGSVNQSVDRMSLEFNEPLDTRTAASAISIIPEFSDPLEVTVRGDRIDIRFPELVRPNTTYILTLDSALKDAHNVALSEPITIAFASGPTLNHGRLEGKVLRYEDGSAAASIDVFAFESDSTSALAPGTSPDYRTQTDAQGNFSLSNLKEGRYQVLALQDRNRNRMIDFGERVAIPPTRTIRADSIAEVINRPWILATIDTVQPQIEAVSALSTRELEVRFSEPVIMSDTSVENWQLVDSADGSSRAVEEMYASDDSRIVLLRHTSLRNSTHILTGYAAVTDSTGNSMAIGSHRFMPSQTVVDDRSDFLGFRPDSLTGDQNDIFPLWPGIQPQLAFSKPPLDEWTLQVSDSLGVVFPHILATKNGIDFDVTTPAFDKPLDIIISGADTTHTRTFMNASTDRQGELSGVVSIGAAPSKPVVVQLVRDDTGGYMYTTEVDESGVFRFSGLPGQTRYLIRAFVDENEDGKWNPGQVNPFITAEPIGWQIVEEIVRARWDTVIADTVRVIIE